ncbi:DEAD-box type RNA helicase, variant 3 [Entomophthora muscae]|uniref:DEAD-box type RNA helicase, variant 3 n=1 Tax=Entomophthora muscae TaxID=34485 RepID=A0ACC2SQX8_9FUNG|nr:DEAD-box type RNA helicase, variant 3 [Entomophthora muscae]
MSEAATNQAPPADSCQTDPASIAALCSQFLADSSACWLNDDARQTHVLNLMYIHLLQTEQTEQFKDALAQHLSQCLPCLIQYINHHEAIRGLFRGKLRDNELSALEDAIEDWDKQRLIKNIASIVAQVSSHSELVSNHPLCLLLSLSLIEMLSCTNPRLVNVFSYKVEALYRHLLKSTSQLHVDLSSFIQLFFHPVPEVNQLTQTVVGLWPQPLPSIAAQALLAGLPASLAPIPELLAEARAQGHHSKVSSVWESTMSILRLFPKTVCANHNEAFLPLFQSAILSLQVDLHYTPQRDRCLVFLLILLKSSCWDGQEDDSLVPKLITCAISLFTAHQHSDLPSFESSFKDLAKLVEYLVRSCESLPYLPSVVNSAIVLVFEMLKHPPFDSPAFKNKIVSFGMQLTEYGFSCAPEPPFLALCKYAPLYVSAMLSGHRRAKDAVMHGIKSDISLFASHTDSLDTPLSRQPLLELWSSLCMYELPARSEVYLLVLASFEPLATLERIAISHTALTQALVGSPHASFGAALAYLDSLLCEFLGLAAQRLDVAVIHELKEAPRGRNILATLLLSPSGPIRDKAMALLSKVFSEDLVGILQSFATDATCRLAAPLEHACGTFACVIEKRPNEADETLSHLQVVISLYQALFNGTALSSDLVELLDSEKSTGFALSLWRLVKGVVVAGVGPMVKALEAGLLSFKRMISSGRSVSSLQSFFHAVAELLPSLVGAVETTSNDELYCVAAELIESILQFKAQLPWDATRQVESLAFTLVNKLPESSRSTFEYRIKLLLGEFSAMPTPEPKTVEHKHISIDSDSDSDFFDLPYFPIPQPASASQTNPSPSIQCPPAEAKDTSFSPNRTTDAQANQDSSAHCISVHKMTFPTAYTNSQPNHNITNPGFQTVAKATSLVSKPSKQVPITLFTTPLQTAPQKNLPKSSQAVKPFASIFTRVAPKQESSFQERFPVKKPCVSETATLKALLARASTPSGSPSLLSPAVKHVQSRPPSRASLDETNGIQHNPSPTPREHPKLSSPVVKDPRSKPPQRDNPSEGNGVALVEKIIAKAKAKPTPIVNQARQGEYPRPIPLKPVLTKKAKKQDELTFASLPHLDPRIPKKANLILARSKTKASQLLKRIQVDQSSVKSFNKPNGESESSSSEETGSDTAEGLHQFLKKSLPATSPCKPPQPSRPPQTHCSARPVTSSSSEDSSEEGECSSSDSETPQQNDISRPILKVPVMRPPPKVNKLMGTLIPTPAMALDNFSLDIDHFDSTVLRWSCEASGDLPVWFNATKPYCTQFRNIPQTFTSIRAYVETLEPLLFLECWAQVQKARDETFPDDAITCSVVGYHQSHNFFDVTLKSNRNTSQFSENDLLMLTLPLPDDASRHYKVLAKMRRTTAIRGSSGVEIRCCLDRDRNLVLACLRPNVSASLLRLTSMATMHRDYLALHGLSSYHLIKDILEGHASGFDEPNPAKVQQLIECHQLNRSQAEAIVASASKKEGFSLIQGPPGTGKTKTILGLVATLRQTTRRDLIQGKYWNRPQKLLICAPSNAAVDEIVRRLRVELDDPSGSPKLIRVGISESINQTVQDQTLDYLIEANLRTRTSGDYQRAKEEMDKFNAKIDQLRAELKKHQCVREELREAANPQDTQRYLASKRQVEEIGDEIDLQFQLRSASSRAMDTARYKVRDDLLNGAEIICCTLSGAGHDMMQNMACEFDTVIIDEAAQSVELASLIPLRFGCRRCIMIGDPHQLPPTVMSLAATKYGYNNSLFARMFNQSNGTAHLLNVQYRMHPAISQLPSTLFYKGRLLDAPGLAESKAAPWHASPLFPPYHFYDVSEGGDTSNRFHSRENTAECEAACAIVRRLCYEFPEVDFKGRIAVISPYKGQISQMKLAFARKFGSGISKTVEFNTIVSLPT